MTLVRHSETLARPRGPTLARIGLVGVAGSLVLTVVSFLVVGDVFDRLEDSLEISAEAVITVDETLDVAAESMAALANALTTIRVATDHASASSETVAEAVAQAVQIVGVELPVSVEAIRSAMPPLIEASAVIDATLSGLALFGVPYNPDVPLDDAFRELEMQLAPLPSSLRENALVLADLVPDVRGFRVQTESLGLQVEEIERSVQDATDIIERYQSQADRFDEVIQDARGDLGRSALLTRVLVVLAGILAMTAMGGLIITGRAITALELLRR